MSDIVNHPSHYIAGRKYEPKDVIRDWSLNFSLGNAVKYISRAGRKDPSKIIEDLEKAIFYINDEIAAIRAEETKRIDDIERELKENTSWVKEFIEDYHSEFGNDDGTTGRTVPHFVTDLSIEGAPKEDTDSVTVGSGESYTTWASSDCEVSAE